MTIEKILEDFRLYAHDEYGEFVSDFMIKDFLKNYIPGKSARSDQFRERLEKYKKELEPIEFSDCMIDNIMDAYNEVHQ